MTAFHPIAAPSAAGAVVAGLLSLIGSLVVLRRLRALGYRHADESGPAPRVGWLLAALATGSGIGLGLRWGLGRELVVFLAFLLLGTALSWTDLDVHRLPERWTLPAYPVLLALLGVATIGHDGTALVRAVVAAVVVYALHLVLALATGGGLGLGDVTLSGLVGLVTGWVGWPCTAAAVISAYQLAGLQVLVLLATRRAGLRSHVAFGPALVWSAVPALVFA